MITIKTSRPRPILLIVIFIGLIVSAKYITPNFKYGLAFSCFLLVLTLLLNYIFAVKEKISLDKNKLFLYLEKYGCEIFIESIQSVEFDEGARLLSINTLASQHTFKIIGFDHKDVRNIVASISNIIELDSSSK